MASMPKSVIVYDAGNGQWQVWNDPTSFPPSLMTEMYVREPATLYGDELRESLAAYAHEAWSHWMTYLFEQCFTNDASVVEENGSETVVTEYVIPYYEADRWKRQMETPYEDLSEPEKESDRRQADKILAILRRACDAK